MSPAKLADDAARGQAETTAGRGRAARHRGRAAVTARCLALGCGILLLLDGAGPAHGYVRTRTDRGNGIFWKESCVFLVPPLEIPSPLAPASALEAIGRSAATWTAVPGSYLRLVVQEGEAGLSVRYNPGGGNKNAIVFVTRDWQDDPTAAALTTITYVASTKPSEDGRILDTDVAVNVEDFEFATDGDPERHDLANVMTHEFGHVVGLDHTCDDGLVVPTPIDDQGEEIPPCRPLAALPPEITDPTMFNYAYPGETEKASLEPDDEAGLAALYPLAEDPARCEPPDLSPDEPCGCTGPGGGGPLGAALVILLLLGRRFRTM
jgi:hypothetical protein